MEDNGFFLEQYMAAPAPKGYEFTNDFWRPRENEFWLDPIEHDLCSYKNGDFPGYRFFDSKRRILRKVVKADLEAKDWERYMQRLAPENYEFTGEERIPDSEQKDIWLDPWTGRVCSFETNYAPASKIFGGKRRLLRKKLTDWERYLQKPVPVGYEGTGEIVVPVCGVHDEWLDPVTFTVTGFRKGTFPRGDKFDGKRRIVKKKEETIVIRGQRLEKRLLQPGELGVDDANRLFFNSAKVVTLATYFPIRIIDLRWKAEGE